jgi:hypothetical protein
MRMKVRRFSAGQVGAPGVDYIPWFVLQQDAYIGCGSLGFWKNLDVTDMRSSRICIRPKGILIRSELKYLVCLMS